MKTNKVFSNGVVSKNHFVIIITFFAYLFVGCSTNEEGFQWLVSHDPNSTIPEPTSELIEGNFSFNISNERGDPDFLFDVEIGDTLNIFTIVLNAESPNDGSLVQIREMSGDQTGRIIFQAVAGENGSLKGGYSIDTNTDEVLLNFTYEGETYSFKQNLINLAKINNTVYLNSNLEAVAPPNTNEPPIADAGEAQIVECPIHDIQLDGSGSSDPDGDELSYTWTYGDSTWVGVNPVVTLPLGEHSITLTVDDGNGETDSDEVTITVVDTTPPELIIASDPHTLWPPNHKYHTFDIADFIVSVSDLCDENDNIGGVVITRVTSDEPENQKGSNNGKGKNGGGGDGNTSNDIIIASDGLSVDLRAERLGGGNGRVYTIFVGVVDPSGNQTESSFQVHVPHNKNRAAVDDGVAYEVTGLVPESTTSDPITVASKTENGIDLFSEPSLSNNEDIGFLPESFSLNQNYPNPFNPSTVISYQVPEEVHVTVEVFDITGRRIASLVNEVKSQGSHEVSFNAENMNSGIYLYRITAGNYSEMKQMTLIK